MTEWYLLVYVGDEFPTPHWPSSTDEGGARWLADWLHARHPDWRIALVRREEERAWAYGEGELWP